MTQTTSAVIAKDIWDIHILFIATSQNKATLGHVGTITTKRADTLILDKNPPDGCHKNQLSTGSPLWRVLGSHLDDPAPGKVYAPVHLDDNSSECPSNTCHLLPAGYAAPSEINISILEQEKALK